MTSPTQPAAVGNHPDFERPGVPSAPRAAEPVLDGPRWLPSTITRTTWWLALASLISEIGIIVTGGAVRLTQSGLGCPTWPKCTPESLTNTPEMGIHGVIEFGNRTLTFVLGIIALAMLLWVWRLRRSHPPLFWMSFGLLLGIPAQAGLGGITVLTDLNPWVVAGHFMVSALMVCVATLLVNRVGLERRVRSEPGTPSRLVDGPTTSLSRGLAWVVFISGWAAVYLGTVVTGTGPHGGDALAPRHDFDPLLVTRIHVVPVYIMVAAAVLLMIVVLRQDSSRRQRMSTVRVLLVVLFQGLIGYVQHFNGLPILLVLLHMLGAALIVWAMTNALDRQRSTYSARMVDDVESGPVQMAEAEASHT